MREYSQLDVSAAANVIAGCKSALVLCHVNPDGDTLGSAQALKRLIELTGGSCDVAIPGEVPERLAFLAKDAIYDPDPDKYGYIIAVDVASEIQLGRFSKFKDKIDLMIDHHSSGEAFADFLIKPDAAAAGSIVFEIYGELKTRGALLPDAAVARCLFAAISSDTGSFKYSNTTPETFAAAAELSSEIANDGAPDTADISRLLHDTLTEKEMAVNAEAMKKMRLYNGGKFAFCFISKEDAERLGAADGDFGGAIDVIRSLKGVEVAVTVRQSKKEPGQFKISSRSACDIDVAKVCASFGGGGHLRAAGATVTGRDAAEVCRRVTGAFSAAVAEYHKG